MLKKLHEHLQIAHGYWKNHLKPTDNAIDATCGNGKDSLFLSTLLTNGKLFCYDIQKKAIENTKELLNTHSMNTDTIQFFNFTHTNFNKIDKLLPIKLITYNLGYLPGGDKSITTMVKSTLTSIKHGLKRIIIDGALSITCYNGHFEGAKEEKEIFKFIDGLDKNKYDIKIHTWHKKNAPSFIWIKKNRDK